MSDPISNPPGDQRDLLRAALERTPQCPPLDALLSSSPSAACLSHLAACPHCRAELALFQQFEAAEAMPAETADLAWVESELARRSPAAAPPAESFADRLRNWFGTLLLPSARPRLALAACALLVLVTVGVALRPGTAVPTGLSQEPNVWRSGRFAVTSPIGDLENAPTQLRWEAVAGAATYHVRLLEVDGTEIWSADAAAPGLEIPAALAPTLAPGRAFQWDVAARDSAGRNLASTNLQSFHILVTPR